MYFDICHFAFDINKMYLVVVESPAKAKTIEKYLGKGYEVLASKGHIADLPKSDLGVDVEHDFNPEYVITNPESLKKLVQAAKGKKGLILAVDPDREGEAIGWHVARNLKLIKENGDVMSREKPVERIVFTEITKEAVQEALKHPRKIDMNLVNAQQARRVLDRVVGYKLSPLLWKKIRYGLSAGRVQSVAVRLVVNKEQEREAFKIETYWTVHSYLNTKKTSVKPEVFYSSEAEEEQGPELRQAARHAPVRGRAPYRCEGRVLEPGRRPQV